MKTQILNLRKTVVVHNPENATQEQFHSYVSTLIASAVTVESIDACKGTVLYNHNLRNAGNNFTKEIERLLRKDPEIWTDTSNELPQLIDNIRQIANKLGRLAPDNMAVVFEFLLRMEADPAGCDAWLGITQPEEDHGTFILST